MSRINMVDNEVAFLHSLDEDDFDLVIYEYPLSWYDGMILPTAVKARRPYTSVVAVTEPEYTVLVEEAAEDLDACVPQSPEGLSQLCLPIRQAVKRRERIGAYLKDEITRRSYAKDSLSTVEQPNPTEATSEPTATDYLWMRRRAAMEMPGRTSLETLRHAMPGVDRILPAFINSPARQHRHSLTSQGQREEQFRALFENADVGIVVADVYGKPIRANRTMLEMLGYTADELCRSSLHDLTHPGDVAAEIESFAEIAAGRLDRFEMEKRYIRKDGEATWAHMLVSVMPDKERRPAYTVARIYNIDHRKRMAYAHSDSNDRLMVTFEYADIGMILADTQGVITEANPAFHRMLGYQPDELLGMHVRQITYTGDSCFLPGCQLWSELVDGKLGAIRMEKRYLHKDGRPVWVRLNISLVKNADHEPLLAIGMIEDLTRCKQAEVDIERRSRELSALNSIAMALSTSMTLPTMLAELKSVIADNMGMRAGRFFSYTGSDHSLHLELQWGLHESTAATIPIVGTEYERVIFKQELAIDYAADTTKLRLLPDIYTACRAVVTRIIVPLFAEKEIQGVLELVCCAPDDSQTRVTFLNTLAQQVGLAFKKARLHEQLYTGHQQLQELSRRLVRVQEDERRHLARELHDEVGGMLTALSMKLHACSHSSPEDSLSHIEQAKEMVKEIMGQVRALSLNLRPALLDQAGLVPALRHYFDKYTAQTHIEVDFERPSYLTMLPSDISVCAFRVVQEALTNVARHADVKLVHVRVCAESESLTVEVSDQGKGLNPRSMLSSRRGIGIAGMRERVHSLGGRFRLTSNLGSGTVVHAILPLVREEGC